MTKPKSKVITVRVRGPLAPYAQEFRLVLTERGYTPLTRVKQLQVMVHLSKWLRACVAGLAHRTRRRPARSAVPNHHRHPAQP